jgi:CxxC motif-containing protein (DUF1111 family)
MKSSIQSASLFASALLFAAALSFPVRAQQGPPPGNAVGGLTPAQRQAFAEGARVFAKDYVVAEGLGPVFNDESCDDCHRGGGGTNRTVTRFGRLDARGDFDALPDLGGSLRQSRGIGSITTVDGTHDFGGERTPNQATISTPRRSSSLRGLGFVDAVPDETWEAIAAEERASDETTAGRVHMVDNLSTRRRAVGKFGWKAQVPTLLQFSADALLNEMGITNPLFRDEPCPQGDCDALAFNPTPALNDDGHDVEAIADFMTMLAAPTRGPVDNNVISGEQTFHEIGCASCHRPTIRTGRSDIAALNRTDFHPYSDFLLHDMGSLGDGIVQDQATGREMRTAPLWGLRNNNRLLHDGRSRSLEDAIRRHDGQGRAARDRFNELDADRVVQLLAFLRSL